MVEGFDYEDTSPHVTHEVRYGDTPMDMCSPYPPEVMSQKEDVDRSVEIPSIADQKAAEAKAAKEPLTAVEQFVAKATQTNVELFTEALENACVEIGYVFNDEWIPEGDPAHLMQHLDNAKNFMALAETYFMALSRPVMQACSVHLSMQAMAPAEPSAEERMSGPTLEGRRITAIHPCSHAGLSGTITGYDPDDSDYLIKFDNGIVEYHERSCFEVLG